MKSVKSRVFLIVLALMVAFSSTSFAVPYTVKAGDSFWKISKKFEINLQSILSANGATERSVIYPGQVIQVPTGTTTSRGTITHREVPKYIVYSVVQGDSLYIISNKYNLTVQEIINANPELTEDTYLQIGQKINIPTGSNIANTSDISLKGEHGELLNWFDTVNKLIPRGSAFKVIDFYTGKSFMAKRTGGSYHSDTETLTSDDTDKLKEIWGGFSWTRRPALIQWGDRLIACSVTAMPHAGNDSAKGGVNTSWRSGGYGAGTNYDYVKGNGMDGHFDIHFYGSLRHKDGQADPQHQKCVKISAGLIK